MPARARRDAGEMPARCRRERGESAARSRRGRGEGAARARRERGESAARARRERGEGGRRRAEIAIVPIFLARFPHRPSRRRCRRARCRSVSRPTTSTTSSESGLWLVSGLWCLVPTGARQTRRSVAAAARLGGCRVGVASRSLHGSVRLQDGHSASPDEGRPAVFSLYSYSVICSL